jgi:hypothetical protein
MQEAVDDWLSLAAGDKAAQTMTDPDRDPGPLTSQLGQSKLRNLTSEDVRKALVKIAQTRSTGTVRATRAALVRAITFAQARSLVTRNVARLIKPPQSSCPVSRHRRCRPLRRWL